MIFFKKLFAILQAKPGKQKHSLYIVYRISFLINIITNSTKASVIYPYITNLFLPTYLRTSFGFVVDSYVYLYSAKSI